MYKRHLNQINLLDEPEYFGGIALDPDNEWVKLAKLIPWHQFEEEYASSFPSGTGQPACSFRMALGSLLIKERYQFSDEETVAHITMNPYLQYFIGLEAFTQKSPFDQSMMTRFRITDLNWQALEWCNRQNGIYHKAVDGVPQKLHLSLCGERLKELPKTDAVKLYLCPARKISFDGFVNYEGHRFGVPYSYLGAIARVSRSGDTLYIYSFDLRVLLATHDVTWSRRDSFCEGQYEELAQPEEFPTAPVKTQIRQLPMPSGDLSFDKFNFAEEDPI